MRTSGATASALSIEGVTKYFGGLVVFEEISFEVGEQEIVSLVGPNGAGKTTLFNIINGLMRPNTGRITYGETDLTQVPTHAMAHLGIARTFQHPRPFEGMTVRENIMVGSFVANDSVRSAMKAAAGAADTVGLGKRLDEPLDRLTLLERKFLEMARAIATSPRLLLLDEVMTGLNPTELADAMNVIRSIRESGTTVLLIEHVMNAVMELSDRVVVLANQQILADDIPGVVSRDPEVLRAYLGEEGDSKREGINGGTG